MSDRVEKVVTVTFLIVAVVFLIWSSRKGIVPAARTPEQVATMAQRMAREPQYYVRLVGLDEKANLLVYVVPGEVANRMARVHLEEDDVKKFRVGDRTSVWLIRMDHPDYRRLHMGRGLWLRLFATGAPVTAVPYEVEHDPGDYLRIRESSSKPLGQG